MGRKGSWHLFQQVWRVPAFFLVPLVSLVIPLVLWQTEAGKGAYILLVSSIFLVTEIVPVAMTVLFCMFLIPMIGVQTMAEVSQAFTNDTYFLFSSCIILAISIEKSNTHSRIALLTLKKIGLSPARLILGFLMIGGILSMFMPNTAVTVMILPIAVAVSETLSDSEESEPLNEKDEIAMLNTHKDRESERNLNVVPSKYNLVRRRSSARDSLEETAALPIKIPKSGKGMRKALQLSVAYSANIGGVATLIGSHPNILFRMTLEKFYGSETGLNFLTYFLICGPVALGGLLLTWISLCLLYVPEWRRCGTSQRGANNINHEEMAKGVIDNKLKELGPVRQVEVTVWVVFAVLLTLWVTRDPQFAPGWGSLFFPGYATDALPAILSAVTLFILPSDFSELTRGRYSPILDWKTVNAKLPWDLLLFSGGLAAISHVAEVSGFVQSMGNQMPDLRNAPSWIVVTVICIASSVLTEVANNSLITAVFLPVLANVAEDSRVNPIYYMLSATMSSMFSFMVPISSFPTMIVYGSGSVTVRDLLKGGIGPKIACIIFLIISLECVGSLVLDVKNFPSWAEARLILRNNQTTITHTESLSTNSSVLSL